MTTFCAADHCPVPVDSATLCRDHRRKLTAALKEVPDYVDELAITTSKVAAYVPRGPRPASRERSMPLNAKTSETAHHYATNLTDWAKRAALQVGEPVIYPRPKDAAAYILRNLGSGRLNGWVDAGRLLSWLLAEEATILRLIDRPAPRWYGGPCPALVWNDDAHAIVECGADLYAETSRGAVQCRDCGTQHTIEDRRDYLITRLDEQIATVTDLIDALQTFVGERRDDRTLSNLIHQWNKRNRVIPVRHIYHGAKRYPMFRIGDVRQLLDAANAKSTREGA